MVLKSLIVCLTLYSTLYANSSILSSLKRDDIKLDKEINELRSSSLKYDWIKPIIASYSYSKSDQFGVENSSKYFRVSLDQPIFKSGGIYFAIKYSQANENFLKISTTIKEQKLIKTLYENILNLNKIDLEIKKLKLKIRSSNIDIKRKKEQYLSGVIDSSFLDSAILNRSKLEQSLLDLNLKRDALISSFKNLSDLDYKDIKLPKFEMIKKDEFIKKNLDLWSAKAKKDEARYVKNMTISNYLPTLSLFGEYSNKDDSYKVFKQQSTEYKNYGLRVSMPLIDINRGKKIEIEKLNYIKSKIAVADRKRELENSFNLFIKQIEILKKRRELAKKDVIVYDKLLKSTKEGLKAGDKTRLDLKTMSYSKQVSMIDARIYDLDIQLQFLDMYSRMSDNI